MDHASYPQSPDWLADGLCFKDYWHSALLQFSA
jgi:hypothetical protein